MTKRITTAAALSLAVVMLLGVNSYARNAVIFNAAGSTGGFQTFALAGYSATQCGTNIWTKKSGASGIDGRSSSIPANTGNIWIIWNSNATTICAYLAVDSVIGAQLFFAVPRATLSIPSTSVGEAGDNLIPTLTDTPLTQTVYNALNNQVFNASPSEVRPEDALFAQNRALASYDPVHYNGLGYGPGPIGTTILSSFSTKSSVPVAFAISGTDPITGQPIPQYTTSNVGAYPVIVFGNTSNNGPGDFGSSNFQNINRFNLAMAMNGTFGRTRDLTNQLSLPAVPLNVILREPTSGTYNTFEFSIPRSVEINSTQEKGVDPSSSGGNPLNITNSGGGWRKRAIGTGEMVSQVGTNTNGDVLGYSFWSTGNFANVVSNTKYFTVDGVDPLFPSYAGGFFPTCTIPCPGIVTFTNLANGSYPIWAMLIVTTAKAIPPGVSALITAAQVQAVNSSPDFIPVSALNVFHSHFTQSGRSPADGYKTGVAEAGGDMGGAVFPVQADLDSITDTGKEIVNLKQ